MENNNSQRDHNYRNHLPLIPKFSTPDLYNFENYLLSISTPVQTRRSYKHVHFEKNLDLPKKLFNFLFKSSLGQCQFIVQEKGHNNCLSLFYDKDLSIEKSIFISNSKFNLAFKQIHKSKSKLFDQNILENLEIDVYGQLIAHSIDLKNFRVIVIVSRKEFLAPTPEEVQKIIYDIELLRPGLESAIKTIEDKKKIVLKKIIFDEIKKAEGNNSTNAMFDVPEIFEYQKIALLGELINTLRHELSNPLFGLSISPGLFSDHSIEEDFRATLQEIEQNAKRCLSILTSFQNLYSTKNNIKRINLVDLIKETLVLAKSELRGISVDLNFWPNEKNLFFTNINTVWPGQILLNLIINACQAMHNANTENPKIEIDIKQEGLNNLFIIKIRDNGPGPSFDYDKNDPWPFRSFLTTKSKGNGLGLTICKKLCEKINANIKFNTNSPSPGVTFSITLPNENAYH